NNATSDRTLTAGSRSALITTRGRTCRDSQSAAASGSCGHSACADESAMLRDPLSLSPANRLAEMVPRTHPRGLSCSHHALHELHRRSWRPERCTELRSERLRIERPAEQRREPHVCFDDELRATHPTETAVQHSEQWCSGSNRKIDRKSVV